ncbi:class I SAM-dependent methyltransferase [Microlunatus panaciterrae]|uniref:Ubiquinone/menaquinone biosynthesis C-methylase UbiE n=1 Tax=Microlunatus panaciterrae TaxID=400768 RepID=A0ABS2RNZ4_9ACTN|nr:class I SAM-dependent methyltransferase [Microlunatus panaciterrae]MBM7800717.1 ubiquinone/menaquinone biosynthesis C-methylase UbiE [Microlunatus panaciterrae]
MGSAVPGDRWSSGEQYEPYIGRWSRAVASDFVAWLGLPARATWLDVGCGTGALSGAVQRLAAPSHLLGVDPSPAFIDYARSHVVDSAVSFAVGDAQRLPADDGSFDAVVSGLVLNFIPDRPGALGEMRRVARSGGVVAAYVWDYPGEMWLLRHFWDAAVELDAAALDLHEGYRFAFCRQAELALLFEAAGFAQVVSRGLVVPTVFSSFDDYWQPFLGGQGPAPTYVRSLDENRRNELRTAVHDRLPQGHDGSISLSARAWAVKARR